MEIENTAPVADATTPNATSELPPEAVAAPADGGVASEDQQPVEDQPAEPQTPPAAKETPPHRKADARMSDLSRQRNEAREEAAYWRGVARAQANGNVVQEPAAPKPTAPAGPPKASDYPAGDYDPAFIKDSAKFELREEQRQAEEARQAATRDAEAKTSAQAGFQRFNDTREAALDLEFSGGAKLLEKLPTDFVDDITRSKLAPYVAEALHQEPDLLAALEQMDRYDRAYAIGDITAQINRNLQAIEAQKAAQPQPAPAAKPAPTPSPAPAPAVTGAGAGPSFNPEKASYEEYKAAREAGKYV